MSPGPATPAASPLPDTGWRMAAAALAWLAGIGLQLQQPALWPALHYQGLLLATLLLALAWRGLARRAPAGALACLCLALALAGFASTGWRAGQRLAQALPAPLEGVDLQLVGVVSGLPQPGPQGTRFVLQVEQAQHEGRPVDVPERVSLGWYRGFDGDALLAAPAQELRAGQRWLLTVRLRQPHGTLNPGGFDLELWLFEQGLGASGTVRATAAAPNRLLAEAGGHPVQRARQAVRDAILLRVADAPAAGVLAALAVGDQAAIDRDDWELFRHTGVAHLMSISGLHVTMFAWLAAALIAPLWRLSPRLMLALPTPAAARWGGVLAATGYALLAGWGVPAQRTLWMLATVALLRSGAVHWPPTLVLLAAAWVVTLLDPWALLQPGFWLSFVAVALLMVAEPAARQAAPDGWLRRLGQTLQRGLRTQALASVGPGAAEPGVLPAGVAGGLRLQPAGHSAGHAGHRAAGAGRHPVAATVGAGQRAGAGPGGRAAVPGGLALRLVDGRRGTRLGHGGRAARRRAAGHAVAMAAARAGPAAAAAVAGAARGTAAAGRSSRWSPPTSARARRCWCAPAATCCCTTPGRATPARRTPRSACCCRCCARVATTASTC